jgi:acyl-CoA thioester hydrolase
VAKQPYEIGIEIQPEDIDALGHVNNVVFLRWVQEAAAAHWTTLTSETQRREVAWVVARHEIDYKQPALPTDRVLARTWVGGATRHTFERHTEILRAGSDVLLARARTLWVSIDPTSGRPMTVSPEVRAVFSLEEAPAPRPSQG